MTEVSRVYQRNAKFTDTPGSWRNWSQTSSLLAHLSLAASCSCALHAFFDWLQPPFLQVKASCAKNRKGNRALVLSGQWNRVLRFVVIWFLLYLTFIALCYPQGQRLLGYLDSGSHLKNTPESFRNHSCCSVPTTTWCLS